TVMVSASNLPLGATFAPNTRTFAWTPNFAQGGPNPYYVQFTASDGQLSDVKTIKIAIADNTSRPDRDGDGVPDDVDNCPAIPNPTQLDVCGQSPEPTTAGSLPAPSAVGTNLAVSFSLTITAGSTAKSWVVPSLLTGTVSCDIINNSTGQKVPPGQIPEIAALVVTDDPGGQLVSLQAGQTTTLTTQFDLITHPNLPEGSYTVACEYRNH